MGIFDNFLDWLGRRLASQLNDQRQDEWPYAPADPAALDRALRPGDVLLVSGSEKVLKAIIYLTQSTWSHAAIYVGDVIGRKEPDGEPHTLVEVNLGEGCVSAPLSKYAKAHTRICRAVSLSDDDRRTVVVFMIARIGLQYDLRNIFDMARFLVPLPVPPRFRRQMISIGSGAPTRAICSTLIAQAFQKIKYPILPRVEKVRCQQLGIGRYSRREILHIRHHSLFAPCDFDLSPYFQVIKPTIEDGFDHNTVYWADTLSDCGVCEDGSEPELEQTIELDAARIAKASKKHSTINT